LIAGALAALAQQFAPRVGAALAALADPDAQPLRARTFTWLAWSALVSVALHAAVLSAIPTLPFRYEPGPLRLALQARLAPPAAPQPSAAEDVQSAAAQEPRTRASRAADADAPRGSAAQPGATLAPRYLTSREVDVPAVPIEQPPLIYPEDPYIWKLPGRVRVRVFIGEDGRVEALELVSAHPPGHFEEAALDAARRLRYAPARLAGLPVRSQKVIEVVFDPHEHLRAEPAAKSGDMIAAPQ
jgi:protein TonB